MTDRTGEALRAIKALAEAEAALLSLGVASTRQNFTGSIGEWMAAKAFGAEQLPTNTKDADLLLPDGRKMEVKTVKCANGHTSFMRDYDDTGTLRNELLLLLLLCPLTNEVQEAVLLNNSEVNKCKSYNSRTKAYVLGVKKVLSLKATNSVKDKFKWH
jgi:hypothetical protein